MAECLLLYKPCVMHQRDWQWSEHIGVQLQIHYLFEGKHSLQEHSYRSFNLACLMDIFIICYRMKDFSTIKCVFKKRGIAKRDRRREDGVRKRWRWRRKDRESERGPWGQTIPSDGVYCLCCHWAWQFDALHCWTKDNSANADSLAYLHIDYLWLP